MSYFHEKARDAKITMPDGEGADGEIELPTRWAICGSCSGNGTTSRHVECDSPYGNEPDPDGERW